MQGQEGGYQLLVAVALSLLLIVIDHRTSYLDPIRYGLNFITAPLYITADIPRRIVLGVGDELKGRRTLQDENAKLKRDALILKRQTQKIAAMTAENIRLRELLHSSELIDGSVLVSEVVGMSPDPLSHEVIIDKGSDFHVYEGQPVLDGQGLMGQVIEVGPFTSRVLLITDSSHALSVQVNRNGVRAIAVGSGSLGLMYLIHVPDTADIKEGDLLVSSGLGQRFPSGYPVARVAKVEHDPGQAFAIVDAYPSARLNRSRHVMLVFSEQIQNSLLSRELINEQQRLDAKTEELSSDDLNVSVTNKEVSP